MARPHLVLLLLALAAAGCAREFASPTPRPPDGGPQLPAGTPCEEAGACASGVCAEGVCCERACAAFETCAGAGSQGRCVARPPGTPCASGAECQVACVDGVCCEAACATFEVCNAPGAVGRCSARPQGSPCDAGSDCPLGFCADGVCCNEACAGDCRSCALPDHLGTCSPAPENTSPRHACGTCGACFGGTCAPAVAGTDPGHDCGPGLACTPLQACGVAGGEACDDGHPCAVGACLAGRCLRTGVVELQAPPMYAGATARWITDLAVGSAGALAVTFTESAPLPNFTSQAEHDLMLGLLDEAGAARAVRLFGMPTGDIDPYPAGVAWLGRQAVVVTRDDTGGCGADGGHPCGLYAQRFTPEGLLVKTEAVDPALLQPQQVRVAAEPTGLYAAVRATQGASDALKVYRRDPDGGSWAPLSLPAQKVDSIDLAQGTALGPVVVYLDWPNAVGVQAVGPGAAWAATAPDLAAGTSCGSIFNVQRISGATPTDGGVTFVLECNGPRPVQVWVTPLPDGGARWSAESYTDEGYYLTGYVLPGAGGPDLWGSFSNGTAAFPTLVSSVWRTDGGFAFGPGFAPAGPSQEIRSLRGASAPGTGPAAALEFRPSGNTDGPASLMLLRFVP